MNRIIHNLRVQAYNQIIANINTLIGTIWDMDMNEFRELKKFADEFIEEFGERVGIL